MARYRRNHTHGQFCGCQSCYLRAVERRSSYAGGNFTGDWDDNPSEGFDEYRSARARQRYSSPAYLRGRA